MLTEDAYSSVWDLKMFIVEAILSKLLTYINISNCDHVPCYIYCPSNICYGCVMPTENTYFPGHMVLPPLGFAYILMLRQISHKLVVFLDFWDSKIGLYFYFTSTSLCKIHYTCIYITRRRVSSLNMQIIFQLWKMAYLNYNIFQ